MGIDVNNEGGLDTRPSSLYWQIEPGCSSRNVFHSVIFTTSFLWHQSEDINQKSLFPKFQFIPVLRFQVMYDYVCSIASIA